ncbi:MAG TPA: ABC transporter permease [Tepidisphaeraceae bacterium]|jgi:ribose/xylose/arabinose/galactoside ABC-type transport system permease subunit
MTTLETPSAPVTFRPTLNWQAALQKLGPLVGFLFVFGLFAVMRPSRFLNPGNLQLMLEETAVVGTAALGMTLIIISGGIDLTPGSAIALCTVSIGLLLNAGLPPIAAAIGGVLVATVVGLSIGSMVIGHLGAVASAVAGFGAYLALHIGFERSPGLSVAGGIVVALACAALTWRFLSRVKLSPFIVTLGLWGSIRGVAQQVAISGTATIDQPGSTTVNPPDTWLNSLLNTPAASYKWMILPAGVWVTILLAIVVALMLRYTKFGRHIYAIGSNEQTARLCGINVGRTKLMIYTLAGVLVGIAGLLQFSYLTMGDSTTANGMELNIIAAVVIGGASLNGGEGGILGSMIGALMMTAVANGCAKMGWSNSVELMVTGGIIIIAVWLDGLRHLRTE